MNRSLAKNFEDGYRAFNMIERRKTSKLRLAVSPDSESPESKHHALSGVATWLGGCVQELGETKWNWN